MISKDIQENKVLEALHEHRSIRHFLDKKISEEVIKEIVLSAQAAPSSSHGQAYSIISVTDLKKRQQLAMYTGNQKHVETSSHFFVYCADLNRLELIARQRNVEMKESLDSTEMFIIATIDATLAAQNTAVAAKSLGLGTVYIGGVRNNPYEISELLQLPYRVYPVFGMCIGYPDPEQIPEKKPRLTQEALFFDDEYKDFSQTSVHIKKYDDIMREYYSKRTQGQRTDTWSDTMTDKRKIPRRMNMKTFLNERGFLLK